MSAWYLDTSALVKRYLDEPGSSWILALTEDVAQTCAVSHLTEVEAAAALAARHRAPGGWSEAARDRAVRTMLADCATRFRRAPVTPEAIGLAVQRTQRHRLRGYDALQLATAVELNAEAKAAGLPPLTFVAADADLLAAAATEGLAVADPADHT